MKIGIKKKTKFELETVPNSVQDGRGNPSFVIADRNGETIEIPSMNISLTLRNLSNCDIKCGPVLTSVYLDNCSDCSFQIAGQQVLVNH